MVNFKKLNLIVLLGTAMIGAQVPCAYGMDEPGEENATQEALKRRALKNLGQETQEQETQELANSIASGSHDTIALMKMREDEKQKEVLLAQENARLKQVLEQQQDLLTQLSAQLKQEKQQDLLTQLSAQLKQEKQQRALLEDQIREEIEREKELGL